MATTDTELQRRRRIAEQIDEAVGQHGAVTAVYVFGSVAAGHVDERSDVDVGVVCDPRIPSADARRELLAGLGSDWDIGYSEANPIWAAFDRGSVDGIPVELHYHTAHTVSAVLDQVVDRGAITTEEVPDRPYTVAGLAQRAWVLRDKEGVFAKWQRLTMVYPGKLKRNILDHYTPLLRDAVVELRSTAERRIGSVTFIFFLGQATDALTSVLFAVNDTYDPAERWAERTVLPTLARVPRDFSTRFRSILIGPFDDVGALDRAKAFEELAAEVLELVQNRPSPRV